MSIQIQGYKPIFENKVYESIEDSIAKTPDNSTSIVLKEILIPTKYQQPTQDDVITYIKDKAQNSTTDLVIPKGLTKIGSTKATELLNNLPDQIIQDLRLGNEQCTTFLRKNTNTLPLKEKQQKNSYLHITYGILPLKLVKKNAEAGTIKSANWYTTALSNEDLIEAGLGQKFTLKILLQDGTSFPPREDLDFLVKHTTYGSRTLEVSNPNYNPTKVSELINKLWAGLSSITEMEKVQDTTNKILDEEACTPLIALYQMITQQVIKKKIMQNMRR